MIISVRLLVGTSSCLLVILIALGERFKDLMLIILNLLLLITITLLLMIKNLCLSHLLKRVIVIICLELT